MTPKKWCLQEGPDYVTAAGANANTGNVAGIGDPSYAGKVANDYALDWIGLPADQGAFDLTVDATSGGGQLRTSLVCRTGNALSILAPTQVAKGSTNAEFTSVDPTGCDAVVAVITNENQTSPSPKDITNANYSLTTLHA